MSLSTVRLTWRTRPAGAVDAAKLRPDVLCTLSRDDVARVELLCGRVWRSLGDLFHIETLSASDAPRIEVEGHTFFIRLAAGMAAGTLIVEGPAGLFAGAGQRGGRMEIRGTAGDSAAAAMSGGQLFVTGDVGNQLAGPLPGTLAGMQGGEIVVVGRAGERAGLRQRRGLIAVAGGIGAYAGHHMRAGTIVAAGGTAILPGIGMQRGTIVCLDGDVAPPPSFGLDGLAQPLAWRLLAKRLRELGFPAEGLSAREFTAFSGDKLQLGRGELLYARP